MLEPAAFHELISGRRQGVAAMTGRWALRCAELPYSMAVIGRNLAYDRGWRRVHHVGVPVVSVGNLTAGGTGKTPVVAWLARWFQRRDVRVVLLSRGYGAKGDARNDEGRELELQLPDVPHLQNPDRVASAATAIAKHSPNLLLLDDAFQHRRIHRDLDIVLVDALEPFGYNHLLPRGLLREPLAGLRRAHVVILSRADLVEPDQRAAIWRTIHAYQSELLAVEIGFKPGGLLSTAGIEGLPSGVTIGAFCGIGNPEGFRRTLEQAGLTIAAFRSFPDHHPYSRADIIDLGRWADRIPGIELIICTRKDWVKLNVDHVGQRSLRALAIDVDVMNGLTEFDEILRPLMAGPISAEPR